MAKDLVASRTEAHGAEAYSGEIDRDCEICTSDITVKATYEDMWRTPMAGAPFKLLLDGAVFHEGHLKDMAEVGIVAGTSPTEAQRNELGTALVPNVPPGMVTFELTQEGTEAELAAKENELFAFITQQTNSFFDEYASEWTTWRGLDATGKARLLSTTAATSFGDSVTAWSRAEIENLDGIKESFLSIVDWFDRLTLQDIEDAANATLDTAQSAMWDARQQAVDGMRYVVSGEALEDAQEMYRGAERIVENYDAIKDFMVDFAQGDYDGVERFITNTLPLLTEGDEGQQWATFIRDNIESWQLVLELVMSDKVRKLVIEAGFAFLCAIPPQVWVQEGVASVYLVTVELVIAYIIGLIIAVIEAGTLGAATPVAAALIAWRASKIARLAAKGLRFMNRVFARIEAVMDKIVEYAQLAVKVRRRNTVQSSVVRKPIPRGRNDQLEQERRRDEDEPDCRVCGNELGRNGHPARSPSRSGETSNRRTERLHAAALANPRHIKNLGFEVQAHHVISINGMRMSGKARPYQNLGYDINDFGNMSMFPSTLQGACHLGCQVHRGNHPASYHDTAKDKIRTLDRELRNGSLCDMPATRIQSKLNRLSGDLLALINGFSLPLTGVHRSFAPAGIGCGNVDSLTTLRIRPIGTCSSGRNHAGGRQAPGQVRENIASNAPNSYTPTMGQ